MSHSGGGRSMRSSVFDEGMDERTVARQLRRTPRGRWRVAARCAHGYPVVIATAPEVDGRPFPALFYLTCPYLVERVAAEESEGGVSAWQEEVDADPCLAERLRSADAAYREARAIEGGGVDPAAGVGIAGQRDALNVKCLHAHVAAFIAGIDDPLGEQVLACIVRECNEVRCREE